MHGILSGCYFLFFFKQKTAYEMRISDWSSDVCSSDLHVEPVVELRIVGDQFLHLGVGPEDVLRIAREGGPAEGADAAAEQRADVGRHEARKVEGHGDAFVQRHLADDVAVVEGREACLEEIQQVAAAERHGQYGRGEVRERV